MYIKSQKYERQSGSVELRERKGERGGGRRGLGLQYSSKGEERPKTPRDGGRPSCHKTKKKKKVKAIGPLTRREANRSVLAYNKIQEKFSTQYRGRTITLSAWHI